VVSTNAAGCWRIELLVEDEDLILGLITGNLS
jgi:hypothetical protein